MDSIPYIEMALTLLGYAAEAILRFAQAFLFAALALIALYLAPVVRVYLAALSVREITGKKENE